MSGKRRQKQFTRLTVDFSQKIWYYEQNIVHSCIFDGENMHFRNDSNPVYPPVLVMQDFFLKCLHL